MNIHLDIFLLKSFETSVKRIKKIFFFSKGRVSGMCLGVIPPLNLGSIVHRLYYNTQAIVVDTVTLQLLKL